jgi:hypothetical protein
LEVVKVSPSKLPAELLKTVGIRGPLMTDSDFPAAPVQKYPEQIWEGLRVHVSYIVERACEPGLPSISAGVASHALEQIAYGDVPEGHVEAYITELNDGVLKSPDVQQNLLGAVLICWIFQSPKPLYGDQHLMATLMQYRSNSIAGRRSLSTLV